MSNEYLNNKVFEGVIARFQKSKKDKIKFALIIEDVSGTIKRKNCRDCTTSEDRALLRKNSSLQKVAESDHYESQQELAAAFYTLSENIVKYARFHLIDPDDAIQEGVVICFEKIDRFDPRKGKAFNYMTTCILNHYRQLYRTARNYLELKNKYKEHLLQQQVSNAIINARKNLKAANYRYDD